jgi:hypothetical protein
MDVFLSQRTGDDLHKAFAIATPGAGLDFRHTAASRWKQRRMPAVQPVCGEGFVVSFSTNHAEIIVSILRRICMLISKIRRGRHLIKKRRPDAEYDPTACARKGPGSTILSVSPMPI